MMPQEVRKDWEQMKSEQGPLPRKVMVSLWFVHDIGLTMIEIMKMMKEELEKAKFRATGERVRATLEKSPQKKPLGRAHAMLLKGPQETRGDETKIKTVYQNLQISFFA